MSLHIKSDESDVGGAETAGERLAGSEDILRIIVGLLDRKTLRMLQLASRRIWSVVACELYKCQGSPTAFMHHEKLLPPGINRGIYAQYVRQVTLYRPDRPDDLNLESLPNRFPNLTTALFLLPGSSLRVNFDPSGHTPPVCHARKNAYPCGVDVCMNPTDVLQSPVRTTLFCSDWGANPYHVDYKTQKTRIELLYKKVRTEALLDEIQMYDTPVDLQAFTEACHVRAEAGLPGLHGVRLDATRSYTLQNTLELIRSLGDQLQTLSLHPKPSPAHQSPAPATDDTPLLHDLPDICCEIARSGLPVDALRIELEVSCRRRSWSDTTRAGTPSRWEGGKLHTLHIQLRHRSSTDLILPILVSARALASIAAADFRLSFGSASGRGESPDAMRRKSKLRSDVRSAVAFLQRQSPAVQSYIQSLSDAEIAHITTFSEIIALVTQFTHPSIRGATFSHAADTFNKLSGIQSYLSRATIKSDKTFAADSEAERALQRDHVRSKLEPHLKQAQSEFNDAFYRLSEVMAGTGYDICGRQATHQADMRFETANPHLSTELIWEVQRRKRLERQE